MPQVYPQFRLMLIEPNGWPCQLQSCPPGLFVFNGTLCFRAEFSVREPFVVETGKVFWGGTSTDIDRACLIVQPCKVALRQ